MTSWALPDIQNSKKIVHQPVDTSYLQGSHFTLSQEDSWTPWARLSTMKKDYIPYNIEDKPIAARPRGPANIFNQDEKYFHNSNNASETLAEFQPKPLSEKTTYDTYKLRKTNFKMDSDIRQQEPYMSIQKSSYPPRNGEINRSAPTMDTTTSHIPQGDKEKAPQPISDYRDKFRGEMADRLPLSKGVYGSSTIKGDNRTHSYSTTNTDVYTGTWQEPLASVPAHRISSIPQGDLNKEIMHQTEFQNSYKAHSGVKGYDPAAVMNMQKTQFRLDDGHNFYNDYGTTMKVSYVPKEATVQRISHTGKRNHSDVPDGDTDSWRQIQRGSTTTYKWEMKPPPEDFKKDPTIDGAAIRTRSQVPFGDAAQNSDFYKTTNQEVYVPQNGKAATSLGNQGPSAIPLDYYPDSMNGTTTQKYDYKNPGLGKLELDERALNRIKKSNIDGPLGAQRFFSTTHRDHFIPLPLGNGAEVDVFKLQKSSVPLGTFN